MEKCLGTYYKHNAFQATVTAILIANDKKYISMKLPTASGKTFIAGMGSSFNILKRDKKVVLVVLNEILKCQM